MEIHKTTDPQLKPSIVMLVYGEGGVGKTTFGSTAPKPLLLDCENGAKYFGLRGIELDVAPIKVWSDMEGIFDVVKSGEYETIIIDPIGELMEKLKNFMIAKADRKLVQSDGSPSMAGWGWLKDTMRRTLKILKDSGLNLILIAHVDEKPDEDRLVKRPMLMTKLSEEVVNMVDIVGYMTVVEDNGEAKRIIVVDPASDKYTAKDRTGKLGRIIPPQFSDIVDAVRGTKEFAWAKNGEKEIKKEEVKEETKKVGNKKSVASKLSKAKKK